jgi:hypothetical protein
MIDRRIRIQSRIWIRMAQKHVDPVDPDPQHYLKLLKKVCLLFKHITKGTITTDFCNTVAPKVIQVNR